MEPKIDAEKCTGCGICHQICPVNPKVMEMIETKNGRKAVIKHPEQCDKRMACVHYCPTKAFKIE